MLANISDAILETLHLHGHHKMPRCLPSAVVVLPEPPLELEYVPLVALVSGSLEVVGRIIMIIGALQGLRVGGPGGLFLELQHDSNCIEHFNFKFLT